MEYWIFLATHPVHKANISQHEKVYLHKKPSLRRCIRRYAPYGDSKAMQEAHVEKGQKFVSRCKYVWAYQRGARVLLITCSCCIHACACSAYRTATLSAQCYLGVVLSLPPLPCLAEVDQQGFAGGQRTTPHRIDRHGGVRAGRQYQRGEIILQWLHYLLRRIEMQRGSLCSKPR